MSRREYELTDAQLGQLLDACKPIPYIIVGGHEPPSQQQMANDAWKRLGEELGFVWDSVQAVPGKPQRVFSAEPTASA